MARTLPPTLDRHGAWRCTEKRSTIVWRRRGFYYVDGALSFDSGANQFREELTETWEVPVTDSQAWPAAIVDPAGLIAQGWRCEDRRWTAPYGVPMARVYQETYRKLGDWQTTAEV